LVAKLRVGGQESMISPLLSSPCDTQTSLPRVRQAMAELFEELFKSLCGRLGHLGRRALAVEEINHRKNGTLLQFSGRSTQRRPIYDKILALHSMLMLTILNGEVEGCKESILRRKASTFRFAGRPRE
jgi:hypothetical protein